MQFFVNGVPAGEQYFHASCGSHFDEYVRRTRKTDFDYCPMNGGWTTHDDLWTGRRLRIKMHASPQVQQWRQAKIVEWKEYLMGPFSQEAHWSVRIAFTDIIDDDDDDDQQPKFQLGDVVEIHSLEGSPRHNGSTGYISKYIKKTGRYQVHVDGPKKKSTLAVKPSNLRRVSEMIFRAHRCNIEGGGILIGNESPYKLSFEWVDAASPKVNLAEHPWVATCPTCRGETTSDEMYGQPIPPKVMDCPVCLEKTECQILNACCHGICSPCLMEWRRGQFDGEPFFKVENIRIGLSDDDIQSRLEENTRDMPSNRCTEAHIEGFGQLCHDLVESTQEGNEESLIQFKKWLLTHPIDLWGPQLLLKYLCGEVGVQAAEILAAHVESLRGTKVYNRFVADMITETKEYGVGNGVPDGFSLTGFPANADAWFGDPNNYHDIQMIHLTELVALKYEEKDDFRSAIRWYEKNLTFLPNVPQHLQPGGRDTLLAASLNNLALAQTRAQLYESALENYNQAIALPSGSKHTENRDKLKARMEEWKGSSGYLTPRLDE